MVCVAMMISLCGVHTHVMMVDGSFVAAVDYSLPDGYVVSADLVYEGNG